MSLLAGMMVGTADSCVDADDELYVLGDFSFMATREEAMAFRSQINCSRVHLVPGNHDKDWSVPEFAGTFILEPPIKVIKDGPQIIVLSHYPMTDWQSMRHGSWHLHGHIHSAGIAYNEANLISSDRAVEAPREQCLDNPERRVWWLKTRHLIL